MNRIERQNDFERRQAVIRDLFDDYRQEVLDYAEFMADFRARTGRMHPLLPVAHETTEAT